jgi:hypothetical protein
MIMMMNFKFNHNNNREKFPCFFRHYVVVIVVVTQNLKSHSYILINQQNYQHFKLVPAASWLYYLLSAIIITIGLLSLFRCCIYIYYLTVMNYCCCSYDFCHSGMMMMTMMMMMLLLLLCKCE